MGYLFVPLFGYFLIVVLGDDSDLAWRILLGIGCIPGSVLMFLRLRQRNKIGKPGPIVNERRSNQRTRDYFRLKLQENLASNSVWDAIKKVIYYKVFVSFSKFSAGKVSFQKANGNSHDLVPVRHPILWQYTL